MPRRWSRFAGLVSACMLFASAPEAGRAAFATLQDFTRSAAHIFRGRCTTVVVETVEVGGVRLPATRYTFQVVEALKGGGSETITFRQVGTPEGGPRDLGRLAGIPVYTPGSEYLLFLLPESAAGLTSPAGAGDAAFEITGDQVRPVHGPLSIAGSPATSPSGAAARSRPPDFTRPVTYGALRQAVVEEVER